MTTLTRLWLLLTLLLLLNASGNELPQALASHIRGKYPTPSGVHEEEVSFTTKGDFRLEGVLYKPSSGITKEAIIVLHGGRASPAAGTPTMPRGGAWFIPPLMAEKGYTTLFFYFRSSYNFSIYKFEEVVDDIRSAVNFLKGKGVEKIHLMGHSLGTPRAAYYAAVADDPTIVSVILVSPMHNLTYKWSPQIRPYLQVYNEAQRLVSEGKGDTLTDTWWQPPDVTKIAASVFLSYVGPKGKAIPNIVVRNITLPIAIFNHADDTTTPPWEGLQVQANASDSEKYQRSNAF